MPYRKQLNFTLESLKADEKTVSGLQDFRARLREAKTEPGFSEELHAIAERARTAFEAGLDDDLNTSVALAAVHNLTTEVNSALACGSLPAESKIELETLLDRFDSVLNIFGSVSEELLDEDIQALIDERQEARRRRDFSRADEIRDQLADQGIVLEDTKDGVRWKRR